MKVKSLFLGDVRFQFKYGFYFIYLFFSILYIGLLFALPRMWREKAAVIMIFTDPSAMGLYFMGSMVLFEKSERVLNSIAVSPVKPWEYVISKLFSIGLISSVVSLAIGIPAGIVINPFFFIFGVFLCSCLFSAVGLMIACKITTLNQFILATIPAEILINVPALIWLFWYKKSWLLVHPGVCIMTLCSGEGAPLPALLVLFFWAVLFTVLACGTVKKMLRSVGGVKL
ncbi:MAG: ABC transporter permease [Oscillospiraceae bacterium]|jgi:fluoroquinolone transport system permease protein|nr:ABC transporter permease [Oscillospiraceae bacterium]